MKPSGSLGSKKLFTCSAMSWKGTASGMPRGIEKWGGSLQSSDIAVRAGDTLPAIARIAARDPIRQSHISKGLMRLQEYLCTDMIRDE